MRLLTNVSHEPRILCHPADSPWITITTFGAWGPRSGQRNGEKDDSLDMPLMGQTVKARPGDVTVVMSGIPVGVGDFIGERYQIELFLPKTGGLVR